MSEAFDRVMEGLADAQRFVEGEREGFVVHERASAETDERDEEAEL